MEQLTERFKSVNMPTSIKSCKKMDQHQNLVQEHHAMKLKTMQLNLLTYRYMQIYQQ